MGPRHFGQVLAYLTSASMQDLQNKWEQLICTGFTYANKQMPQVNSLSIFSFMTGRVITFGMIFHRSVECKVSY